MKRGSAQKLLECAGCGRPTRAGAEAARVLCDVCAAAGKDFPRARQLELFREREAEAPGRRDEPAKKR